MKNSVKLFLPLFAVFLLLSSFVSETDAMEPPSKHFSLQLDTPMAYTLGKGMLEFTLFTEQLNDTIDVLNYRKNAAKRLNRNLDTLGNFGDYESYGGLLNFGISDSIMVSAKLEFPKIDYGLDNLDITGFSGSIKWNFVKEGVLMPALAVSADYKNDRGDNINIKREFNSLDIKTPDGKVLNIDFLQTQSITISGVEDETFTVRAYASKYIFNNFVIHAFAGYGRTEVKTGFSSSIDIDRLNDFIKDTSYDEDEFSLGLGFHYKITDWLILNGNYKYIKVDRDIDDKITGGEDSNNVIDVKLNVVMGKYISMTLSGKYFSNSLIGEMPFIYNRFTADQFGNEYGYVGLGFTVHYDYRDVF